MNLEKHFPNIIHHEDNKSLNSKEKRKNQVESKAKRDSFIEKIKSSGKKTALAALFTAGTFFGSPKSTEAQPQKESPKTEIIVNMPNGKQMKFKSLKERNEYFSKKNMILTENDGTIIYPDGRVVNPNHKEIKKDTIDNPLTNPNNTFILLTLDHKDGGKVFNSYQETIDFMKDRKNNYDPTRIIVDQGNGKKTRLTEFAYFKQHKQELESEYAGEKRDIDRNGQEQKREVGDNPLTNPKNKFLLLTLDHKDGGKVFNSYQETIDFMKDRKNNYDPTRIIVDQGNGKKTRLTEFAYFKQHKQELESQYIGEQKGPREVIKNKINNPLENIVNEDSYNYYFQRLPMGKGQVLNYDENGTATLYKYLRNEKKITLKKLINTQEMNANGIDRNPIDLTKLFNSVPNGKGEHIDDNGNGTATVYKVSKNEAGDKITITFNKIITVF